VSRFRFASLSGTFTNVAYVPSDVKTFDKLFFNFFKLILGKALSLFWGRKPRIICKNFSKFLKFLFFGPKMGPFLALLPLLPLLGLLSPLFHWILRSNFNWGLIPPHATKAHRLSWLSYLYIVVSRHCRVHTCPYRSSSFQQFAYTKIDTLPIPATLTIPDI
jgi:hypothetical protein